MNLIFRRFMSATINATIISICLLFIFLFVAFLFWFVFPLTHLNTRWFALAFALTYSALGAYSIGFLPRLGNIIARIETRETLPSPYRNRKLAIRLLVFYSMPAVTLAALRYPLNIFGRYDAGASLLLLFPNIFCAVFSILVIPISIVLGRGMQGLHDTVSGLHVCKLGSQEPQQLLRFGALASRTAIASSIIGFILTATFMQVLFLARMHEPLVDLFAKPDAKNTAEKMADEFASIVPLTPMKCSKWDATGSFRWWVDLTCKETDKSRVIRDVGLPLMNSVDLLGYGFSIERLDEQISLLHMNRSRSDTLPVGAEVLSIYLFLDDGAFYFPEIKGIIQGYFLEKTSRHAIAGKFAILRVKMIRVVKVGLVEIGYFEEYYIYKRALWRNKENAYLPIIFNFDSRNIAASPSEGGSYITSTDLK